MTSAAVDSGQADHAPVDSGHARPCGLTHSTRTGEAHLGVAAPPLLGHRSMHHHDGAAAAPGGRT